jgi:hypothetical protein
MNNKKEVKDKLHAYIRVLRSPCHPRPCTSWRDYGESVDNCLGVRSLFGTLLWLERVSFYLRKPLQDYYVHAHSLVPTGGSECRRLSDLSSLYFLRSSGRREA